MRQNVEAVGTPEITLFSWISLSDSQAGPKPGRVALLYWGSLPATSFTLARITNSLGYPSIWLTTLEFWEPGRDPSIRGSLQLSQFSINFPVFLKSQPTHYTKRQICFGEEFYP